MHLKTVAAAAALAFSLSGTAWAQGAPGGNGSGGNVTGGSMTGSSAADTKQRGATEGSTITTQPSNTGGTPMRGDGAGGSMGAGAPGGAGGTGSGAR